MTNPVGRSGFFVGFCRQKVTLFGNQMTIWLKISFGSNFD